MKFYEYKKGTKKNHITENKQRLQTIISAIIKEKKLHVDESIISTKTKQFVLFIINTK